MDITETQPVFIGRADDTNEFGVEIEVGALTQHMRVETAREFAREILAAADRAEENDQAEAAERAAEQAKPFAFDRTQPVYELDAAHTGPHLIIIDDAEPPKRQPRRDHSGITPTDGDAA